MRCSFRHNIQILHACAWCSSALTTSSPACVACVNAMQPATEGRLWGSSCAVEWSCCSVMLLPTLLLTVRRGAAKTSARRRSARPASVAQLCAAIMVWCRLHQCKQAAAHTNANAIFFLDTQSLPETAGRSVTHLNIWCLQRAKHVDFLPPTSCTGSTPGLAISHHGSSCQACRQAAVSRDAGAAYVLEVPR